MTRTPRERMDTDPVFRTLVYSFYSMFEQHCGSGAGITPSEIREASGYAWQMYLERHSIPIPIVRGDDDVMNVWGR